jgi:hypothetical protein
MLSRCPTTEDFTFTTEQFQVSLFSRLMIPVPSFVSGSKCPCKKENDPFGIHLTSRSNKDGSLHRIHDAVLGTISKAGKHFGYKVELEINQLLNANDHNHKRPGIKITNWPDGEIVIDLAISNPISMSTDLSLNAANDPDRLLRKRSQQKISKYRQQVEATGARFEALVIGTTGLITDSSMKLLEVLCGKSSGNINTNKARFQRTIYHYWLSRISFALQKTIASEILEKTVKINGDQYNSQSANYRLVTNIDILREMAR